MSDSGWFALMVIGVLVAVAAIAVSENIGACP